MLKHATLFVFAFVVLVANGWAQQDPFLGTWNLNVTKSQLNGNPPRSRVDRYEAAGKDGISYTSETINAQGVSTKATYTAQFDGKVYPMTGSSVTDEVSLVRHNPNAFTTTTRKGGQIAGQIHRFVTKDGKTMIMTSGAGLSVFDRQ